jgi:hypothetical protein
MRRGRTVKNPRFYVAASTLDLMKYPRLREIDYAESNPLMYKLFEDVFRNTQSKTRFGRGHCMTLAAPKGHDLLGLVY